MMELTTVRCAGLSLVDLALRTGSRRMASRIVLMWLTWMVVSCPVERVVLRWMGEIPAFKITKSMCDSSVLHLRTKDWIELYDSISSAQTSMVAVEFARRSFEAAALPFSIERTTTTRCERPRLRSCLADSKPRPQLEPVMIATLFSKLPYMAVVGSSIVTLNWLFQKTLVQKFFGRVAKSLEATETPI